MCAAVASAAASGHGETLDAVTRPELLQKAEGGPEGLLFAVAVARPAVGDAEHPRTAGLVGTAHGCRLAAAREGPGKLAALEHDPVTLQAAAAVDEVADRVRIEPEHGIRPIGRPPAGGEAGLMEPQFRL